MSVRYYLPKGSSLAGHKDELRDLGFKISGSDDYVWVERLLYDTIAVDPFPVPPDEVAVDYVTCFEWVIGHAIPQESGINNDNTEAYMVDHTYNSVGSPIAYINIRAKTLERARAIYLAIRQGRTIDLGFQLTIYRY